MIFGTARYDLREDTLEVTERLIVEEDLHTPRKRNRLRASASDTCLAIFFARRLRGLAGIVGPTRAGKEDREGQIPPIEQ